MGIFQNVYIYSIFCIVENKQQQRRLIRSRKSLQSTSLCGKLPFAKKLVNCLKLFLFHINASRFLTKVPLAIIFNKLFCSFKAVSLAQPLPQSSKTITKSNCCLFWFVWVGQMSSEVYGNTPICPHSSTKTSADIITGACSAKRAGPC